MGRAAYDACAEARAVFEAVDEALDAPLSRIVFDGPEDELRLTENAQPALMATSLAILRVLEKKSGRPLGELAAFVAGHSLGEYTALAAAGALDVGAAARLLRLRGRAMQAAVPVGEGAMAAILGLELETVEEVAQAASASGVCDVANDNAPGQAVVSGARGAVERAVALARDKGAKRSMLLAVSAPFHCRLLAPAAEAMRGALEDVALGRPAVPVVTNVTAAPEDDPATLKRRLVAQVTARVRWRESLITLAGHGVRETVEVGAGRVLCGLTRRTISDTKATALGAPADVDAFVAGL